MNPGMTWEVILRQISATDRDDRIKSLKRFIGTAFAFSALEKEAQVHLLAHEFGQSAIVFGIINEIDRVSAMRQVVVSVWLCELPALV